MIVINLGIYNGGYLCYNDFTNKNQGGIMFRDWVNKFNDYRNARREAREVKQKEEARLSRIYPRDVVYCGYTTRDIVDADVAYSYTHCEYFLADAKGSNATTFMRITGENCNDGVLEFLSKEEDFGIKPHKNIGSLYVVEDGQEEYMIWTDILSSPSNQHNGRMCVTTRELEESAHRMNAYSQSIARENALMQKTLEGGWYEK